ncbi:hypothetical protein [Natrinema versiforme]|uniref:Uncharacterized protein n=1 Tax=Natrinema versiforme JCM 10478 TaxID=1227496 RepID=L9XP90_9EURY|nr:hypothetical protein [Natrinema versiforme]ELY63357.1 hypothetical protein C489_19081 [Natrinema versiforme JCM 10478]
MAAEESVSTSERLLFAMLVGAVFGAAFGTAVLEDSTHGIEVGCMKSKENTRAFRRGMNLTL